MRTKQVNLLTSLVAAVLFSFSCFCISRMTQLSNQLINCRNHILEFKDNILHLRNKSEKTHQELSVAFSQIKNQFPGREHLSVHSEKKVDENGAGSKLFEVLKYFFPHLRKVDRIYPDVILSKEKTGASFALGISTVNRGNHSYLKQTLTSLLSRMALSEEKDCVVIVSVADSNGEYLKSVVDMVTKKFQRQLRAGSLEVISIPTFFYPSTFQDKPSTELSQRLHHWQMKQLLDFCFLMLYAQPKATYYLQLEDDIIAKKKYLTQITDFIHNITSNNWFYIEFSAIGFIGKLFKSEDLIDFVQFFLMFYKDKPIDLLLGEIFRIKMCRSGESPEKCLDRNKDTHIYYKPSLFQHVGTRSSFSEKTQYLKLDSKHILKRILKQTSWSVLPIFSSLHFLVPGLTSKPLINFEWTFVHENTKIINTQRRDPSTPWNTR